MSQPPPAAERDRVSTPLLATALLVAAVASLPLLALAGALIVGGLDPAARESNEMAPLGPALGLPLLLPVAATVGLAALAAATRRRGAAWASIVARLLSLAGQAVLGMNFVNW